MSGPYLGGTAIRLISWQGTSTIRVDFRSTYGSRFQYQLYAGRSLIGQTMGPLERMILAPLVPTDWPQYLQLVTVEAADRLTHFGRQLPPRPYNKATFDIVTSSWPTDSKVIEVASGLVPGGAVDAANVLARENWRTDTNYSLTTTPVGPSGEWNFEIAGRDDKPVEGNRGTPLALSANLLTQPRDFLLNDDGSRFQVSVADNVLTASFTYRD